jgi:hypothetical protein
VLYYIFYNNPILKGDKLKTLLISKVTDVAMLNCSGESVLSAVYKETTVEEFVGKNVIPAKE